VERQKPKEHPAGDALSCHEQHGRAGLIFPLFSGAYPERTTLLFRLLDVFVLKPPSFAFRFIHAVVREANKANKAWET